MRKSAGRLPDMPVRPGPDNKLIFRPKGIYLGFAQSLFPDKPKLTRDEAIFPGGACI